MVLSEVVFASSCASCDVVTEFFPDERLNALFLVDTVYFANFQRSWFVGDICLCLSGCEKFCYNLFDQAPVRPPLSTLLHCSRTLQMYRYCEHAQLAVCTKQLNCGAGSP